MELQTEQEIEIEKVPARFFHRVGTQRRHVEADEVLAFHANLKYVDAYLRDGSVILLDQDTDTIKGLAIEFREFSQINRGTLVRRSEVTALTRDTGKSNYSIFVGGFEFAVSRRCVPAAKEAYKHGQRIAQNKSVGSGINAVVAE